MISSTVCSGVMAVLAEISTFCVGCFDEWNKLGGGYGVSRMVETR